MKNLVLLAFAGPNGSGKSTITAKYPPIGYYVNADEIQRKRGCSPMEAAQIAEDTREYLLAEGESFTFETVLSTPRNLDLMKRAKLAGYHVACIYVLTIDPEINIARVESREKDGGHGVPPEKVRARYYRAMKLIPELIAVCDELYVYDNSPEKTEGEPQRIVCKQNGDLKLSPGPVWSLEMIAALCRGKYHDNGDA